LGVNADLSTAASGWRVIFKPTSGRTEFILDTLQKAKKDNYLGPRVAATLLGKLYVLLITGAYFESSDAASGAACITAISIASLRKRCFSF